MIFATNDIVPNVILGCMIDFRNEQIRLTVAMVLIFLLFLTNAKKAEFLY